MALRLALCALLLASTGAYRHLQEDELHSFDGDVSKIQDLAFAASQLTDAPTSAPTATPIDSTSVEDPFTCADRDIVYMQVLTWDYSLETTAGSDVPFLVSEVEKLLQTALSQRLLVCSNPDATEANIVAERALPDDRAQPDFTCSPKVDDAHECHVYEGRMRIFLGASDGETIQTASNLALWYIKDLMNAAGAQGGESLFAEEIGQGLVKLSYLGPDVDEIFPTSITANSAGGDEGLSNGSISLLAIASAAAVLVTAGFIYMRRKKNDQEGDATQMAGSTILDESNARPSSPFSEMLPSAYRFNENMSILSGADSGLSAVVEQPSDEETMSQALTLDSNDILMSDGGYTTDAGDDESYGLDVFKSLYSHTPDSPNLLGARKLSGSNIQVDNLSETSSPSRKALDSLLPENPNNESVNHDDNDLLFV